MQPSPQAAFDERVCGPSHLRAERGWGTCRLHPTREQVLESEGLLFPDSAQPRGHLTV